MMHVAGAPGSPDFDPAPEITDCLDETLVSIPCYEPAGLVLEISGLCILNHSLLCGGSGTGKTSTLRWFLKHLIQHRSSDPARKPGVFVFDLNADDTVALVQHWARQAGRSEDLRFLTPKLGHLDLFAHIRTLEDLSIATSQFMHGRWSRDADNGYWAETTRALIDAALTICLVVEGRLDTEVVLRFLTNWLVAKRATAEDERPSVPGDIIRELRSL